MKLSITALSLGLMLLAAGANAAPVPAGDELCHNGGFSDTEDPLDGWMVDYTWSGISHYMDNKSHITFLPRYDGKSGVMHVDGRGGETKVECLPIPFEVEARYRCTIDYKSTAGPHIYFTGYKWEPGIRPYADKPVHLGDLRRIYKSEFRNHKVSALSGGWKRETFEFPMANASELSLKHLRPVRFITVYFILVAGSGGEAWIDNVSVKRIK